MAIFPLPEFNKPIRLLNFYPAFMAYTNNMPLTLTVETSNNPSVLINYDRRAMAEVLDRNNPKFNFYFRSGRVGNGDFQIVHIQTNTVLAMDPNLGRGWAGGKTEKDLIYVGGIDLSNTHAVENCALDWFINAPNFDMICHSGYQKGANKWTNSWGDAETLYFLETTPTVERKNEYGDAEAGRINVDKDFDGNPCLRVHMFPWSQGGTPNQRWTWEYV
jgi:hypothetical protein